MFVALFGLGIRLHFKAVELSNSKVQLFYCIDYFIFNLILTFLIREIFSFFSNRFFSSTCYIHKVNCFLLHKALPASHLVYFCFPSTLCNFSLNAANLCSFQNSQKRTTNIKNLKVTKNTHKQRSTRKKKRIQQLEKRI